MAKFVIIIVLVLKNVYKVLTFENISWSVDVFEICFESVSVETILFVRKQLWAFYLSKKKS